MANRRMSDGLSNRRTRKAKRQKMALSASRLVQSLRALCACLQFARLAKFEPRE
jgi:hypothetical protein